MVNTFIHKHFKTYSFFNNIYHATDAWLILCTNKTYTCVLNKSYLIFPIMKCSVNALMKLAGFSTSNIVKNHCVRQFNFSQETMFALYTCL